MTADQINTEIDSILEQYLNRPGYSTQDAIDDIKAIVIDSLPPQLPLRDLKTTHRNDLINELKKLWS